MGLFLVPQAAALTESKKDLKSFCLFLQKEVTKGLIQREGKEQQQKNPQQPVFKFSPDLNLCKSFSSVWW